MKKRLLLLLLSCLCFGGAAILAQREWGHYQAVLAVLPEGSTIAGIPVGGLDRQAAGVRLAQTYLLTPVEAHYHGIILQIDPQKAGFQLGLEEMLGSASQSAPLGFWDFLLNHRPAAIHTPLKASLDKQKLQAYLTQDVAPYFIVPPTRAVATLAGWGFQAGQKGETLNVSDAVEQVSAALFTLDQRVVTFHSDSLPALPPDFDQLDLMLSRLLQTSGFPGMIEIYLQDLKSGREINLAYYQGRPAQPGIAFTAASTIKIPVMVSAFRSLTDLPADLRQQMELMIDRSDNSSTDAVMQKAIDENLAPLQVTQDMARLGFENTFLAGMFYPGAPLLKQFSTPANLRADLTTEPDPYNQTTPREMGRLLAAIQTCADGGGGPLREALAGDITRDECQVMIDLLVNNRKAVLIEAGLPEGVPLAHKYGWVIDPLDGLMHNVSDAAIVYTPQGNFVWSVYVYDSNQLLWDTAQALVAHLTAAVIRYYEYTGVE